jgi:hypothetical protein
MRRLWYDIQAHRLTAALLALCWLGTWLIAAMMRPEAAGLLHFLLVFVASVFVGWWHMPATATWIQVHLNDSIKHGFLVGVLVMEIDLVIIWIADKLSAPAVETTTNAPWWGTVLGVLAFFLGFGLIAGAAGMIGGLLGGTLAYAFHRWHRRGGPAAPADVF